MKTYLIVGNLGQWISCALFGVGITFMFVHKWDAADTIITTGALIFSAFTKLKLLHFEIEESKQRSRRRDE